MGNPGSWRSDPSADQALSGFVGTATRERVDDHGPIHSGGNEPADRELKQPPCDQAAIHRSGTISADEPTQEELEEALQELSTAVDDLNGNIQKLVEIGPADRNRYQPGSDSDHRIIARRETVVIEPIATAPEPDSNRSCPVGADDPFTMGYLFAKRFNAQTARKVLRARRFGPHRRPLNCELRIPDKTSRLVPSASGVGFTYERSAPSGNIMRDGLLVAGPLFDRCTAAVGEAQPQSVWGTLPSRSHGTSVSTPSNSGFLLTIVISLWTIVKLLARGIWKSLCVIGAIILVVDTVRAIHDVEQTFSGPNSIANTNRNINNYISRQNQRR